MTGLLSIGYEGLHADDVLDSLVASGVGLVADVRLTPRSRTPGLSKTALADRLRQAGIGYTHLRALGNPRDNRAGFADPDDTACRARYRQLLRRPEAQLALQELVAAARQTLVAVLCVEADERTCHRALVIAAAAVGLAP